MINNRKQSYSLIEKELVSVTSQLTDLKALHTAESKANIIEFKLLNVQYNKKEAEAQHEIKTLERKLEESENRRQHLAHSLEWAMNRIKELETGSRVINGIHQINRSGGSIGILEANIEENRERLKKKEAKILSMELKIEQLAAEMGNLLATD